MSKPLANGVTRRDLGIALAAASAAVVAAQETAPTEDLLGAVREQVKTNSQTLRAFEVPTATEPSFAFRP
ncbi:MAG TPA: hypothetical protein VER03_24345 [Bryobacteraceae bacterium]|nr:hypothetical protein [Bryobacteraceae bacterium]